MLVSDIHGLDGPFVQRAGMVVSAEATLHFGGGGCGSLARQVMSRHTVGM